MTGILILESLTRGNTLKQGDKTPLTYRLLDADGDNLNIAGKTATVRLVHPNYLTIGYEKTGLIVSQDDTVTFTIDNIIPSRKYNVEIIVDDKFVFPSRSAESKFTIDRSTLGTESNIIEIVGKDVLIRTVKSQVDTELQPLVTSMESAEQAEAQRVLAENERSEIYESFVQQFDDVANAVNYGSNLEVHGGVNLFNKDTTTNDYLLLSDGTLSPATGWSTSDFIEVGANKLIGITGPRFYCEYDVYRNVISGTFVDNSTQANKTFTTTANTKYIRFTTLKSGLATVQCTIGGLNQRRYPYSNKAIIKTLDNRETYVDNAINSKYETKPIGNQLFDVKTVNTDSVLNSNGTLNANNIGWDTSDFIEVNQDKVVISLLRSVHQYDKYKEPIPDTYLDFGVAGVTNHTLTLHPNAKYIRFTYYSSSNIMVNYGETLLQHEEIKYGLFIDGQLVHDLETSTQDTSTSLPSQDLSKIDHSKVTLGQLNIISNFDDGSWVQVNGSNMETSTTYTRGKGSIKTTSVNGVSESIAKEVNVNLKDKVLYLNIYIEDVTKLSMLQFFFGTSGIPDYYGWYPPIATFKNGWNTITITTNSFSPKNALTDTDLLESVKEIRIMNKSKEGKSSVVIFDNISYADSAISRGKVILQFDDQWDGTWKYAKPIMDKYGMRGVIYVIKDLVGRDQFMTFDQLKTCYEQGWDLGTHGQVELTTLTTPEAIRTELLKNYDYLMDNGFVRSACHYCTPAGKYNDMSLLEIKKLFKTHRTTKFGYNTLPTNSKYELFNIGGNESELPFLKAVMDNTEKNKTLTIMNWHQIVDVPTGEESMTPGLKNTFEDFINYLSTKNVDVVTLSDVFNPLD